MSRTRRRSYTGAARHTHSCRNHESCPWCRANRTYNDRRRRSAAAADLAAYLNYKGVTHVRRHNP